MGAGVERYRYRWFVLIVLAGLLLAACQPTPLPTLPPVPPSHTLPPAHPPSPEDAIYLSIVWHQHQPLYYKDPETGVYARPWVRVHGTKDYHDMAAMVEAYPDVHVTFNLTPSLIKQLEDFVAGAKDQYWMLAEKPAAELTDEEKLYILRHFFDANWDNQIGVFPRYRALLDKRGTDASADGLAAALERFTERDLRNLQVWFNLAWFDPDFLAQEPLKGLVEKGEGFTEEDKRVVFDKTRRILAEILPVHARLQQAGQIEVTMTPYAHPILPLLYATDLAKVGAPDATLPERFSFPQDGIAQVERGVARYREIFGQDPRGMWPAEGAVAQEIVKMVSDAGLLWMASGEQVLARSLGIDAFTRDSQETVQEADLLYRPYYVRYRDERPVAIVFRDLVISDKIGFTYSGMPGKAAARDLLERVHAIHAQLREEGATGPHLVSVILDGENAWQYYENDGKEFLHEMYRLLSEDETIQTVTPSEYLALYPEQREIENLWAGCWFSPDFATWIGEDEENLGWEYLRRTRKMLDGYVRGEKAATEEQVTAALGPMYAAEGSDWFWWYGADQDSGDDPAFDLMYRQTLMDVYRAVGEEPPAWLSVPIIPRASPPPAREVQGLFTPTVDGVAGEEEWAAAGFYRERGGAMVRAEDVVDALYYGYDQEHLYVQLEGVRPWVELGEELEIFLYLGTPGVPQAVGFSRYGAGMEPPTVLGFGASHEVAVDVEARAAVLSAAAQGGGWGDPQLLDEVALAGATLELAVPFEALGDPSAGPGGAPSADSGRGLRTGDRLTFVAVVSQRERDLVVAPSAGPAQVVVPELQPITAWLTVEDPEGDDHGPGSYTYPTDSVFDPGAFDLREFVVGTDGENLVFSFSFFGPLSNPWGSGSGLAVQALDVYVDVDGAAGSGSRLLLPGRNAALPAAQAWDVVVWAEGWTPGVYRVDEAGHPKPVSTEMKAAVDPVTRKVTIRVPRSAFPEGDPATWGYLGVVLGQEGFPATGVWRVRDVELQAAQWRFGGGPGDTNHTRVIDLAWPAGATPTQEEMLSAYPPSQEADMDALGPDDFAQVRMLVP
ncbi:MAG TPA: glucodextranase DOMON-like domain-containing protein [Anaerolineae bacterium]|nr:glucodextranase DOMON-like domain-containing protein [Anaerolineae bacterium]